MYVTQLELALLVCVGTSGLWHTYYKYRVDVHNYSFVSD